MKNNSSLQALKIVEVSGSRRDIGRQTGEALRDEIREHVALQRPCMDISVWRKRVSRFLTAMCKHLPHTLEEMRGLARAYKVTGPWEKYPGNPVFKPSPKTETWDDNFVQHPCPVNMNNEWRLYYSGHDHKNDTYSIGAACLAPEAS